MANNYEQYSEVIECDDTEQQNWLIGQLRQFNDNDDEGGIGSFEQWPHTNHVWIYAEEFTCNLDDLTVILQKFLKHFDIDRHIVISISYTCSKMRIAEFGGSAIGIMKDSIRHLDARQGVIDFMEE